jgi:hypothetical protein
VGLADPFKTVSLDQFNNPAKPRFHVVRQDVKLFSNAIVEKFHDPCHRN